MKVTVVTVVFNAAALLEPTLQSVAAQSHDDIEYLVIDGGSTDGTLDIVERYRHALTRCLSEPDNGIYDAMNKAVALAEGEWIIFMNAGDRFYDDTTVERVLAAAPADAEILYGDTCFYSETGKEELIAPLPVESLWQYMVFNHNSSFSRTALLKAHPFNPCYRVVADAEFFLHCYKEGRRFHYLEFPVNYYLRDGFSDQHAVFRLVERWKLVYESKLAPPEAVNAHYFERIRRTFQHGASTPVDGLRTTHSLAAFEAAVARVAAAHERFILYGGGTAGHLIAALVPTQIAAVIDRHPERSKIDRTAVLLPEALETLEPLPVLITVLGREQEIAGELSERFGVAAGRILVLELGDAR